MENLRFVLISAQSGCQEKRCLERRGYLVVVKGGAAQ